MTDGGALLEVLEDARSYGFLGPGPLDPHLASARRFLQALAPRKPGRVLDLGSGGGVPALPLALWLPGSEFVLLDAMERRTEFLAEAVARLHLGERVSVVRERAEVAGRAPELRGAFAAVTARSFGAPAVTAECGAPFLAASGLLVVSEPPEPQNRWPAAGLALLGLRRSPEPGDPGVAVLEQHEPLPERYPRRAGVPTKRPLF